VNAAFTALQSLCDIDHGAALAAAGLLAVLPLIVGKGDVSPHVKRSGRAGAGRAISTLPATPPIDDICARIWACTSRG
jgi:hypothetical protein